MTFPAALSLSNGEPMIRRGMALLGIALFVSPVIAGETPVLETQKEKRSYGIGVQMGRNLKRQGSDFDPDLVIRGMKDGFSDNTLLIPEKELRKILIELQAEMRMKARQRGPAPEGAKP